MAGKTQQTGNLTPARITKIGGNLEAWGTSLVRFGRHSSGVRSSAARNMTTAQFGRMITGLQETLNQLQAYGQYRQTQVTEPARASKAAAGR